MGILREQICSRIRKHGRFLLSVASLNLCLLAIIAGYVLSHHGSLKAEVAVMRGEGLLVESSLKTVAGIIPGSQVVLDYRLTNISDHPIQIIGMNTSCSCTTLSDIPMTLSASETRSVAATITTSEGQSLLKGSIFLYTDDPRMAEIELKYSVCLISPPR